MERTVIRIGWEKENPHAPIILLDGKSRVELGVSLDEVVKVKTLDEDGTLKSEMPAIVCRQFKALVRSGATLNTRLAQNLSASIESTVVIERFTGSWVLFLMLPFQKPQGEPPPYRMLPDEEPEE